MPYYPKSQIKPDLYTNGNVYKLSSNGGSYTGYYYEVSNGKKYTGRNPQQGPNILLLPIIDDVFNTETNETILLSLVETTSAYIDYPSSPQKRYLPTFNPTTPTSQDQQNGQFTRYFCKRNNEPKYLEISKTTFNQLYTKSPEIAWDLYTPVSILWQIKGDKNKVYVSNKALTESIETKFKWYGFSQYFQGKFLKYYVES
jgi:hypothetical protein